MWTYLWSANGGTNSTYGPTKSHRKNLSNANKIFVAISSDYNALNNKYKQIKPKLESIGAPKTEN